MEESILSPNVLMVGNILRHPSGKLVRVSLVTENHFACKPLIEGDEIKGFSDWKKNSGEITGSYYEDAVETMCENKDKGDYTYNNKGTTVGAKITK